MENNHHLQRTMSLTDVNTSSAIRDGIERDVTIPADKNKHRFLLCLPRHNFVLPSLTRFDQDFRKFLLSALVDLSLMRKLEASKCINWCSILPRFLPLLTMGDGNCLMHAASLCMWAVHDRRLTLRKTVYQVLIEDQAGAYRKRWLCEQQKHLAQQSGSPVDCSKEQWEQDWIKTVKYASTTKSTVAQSLHSLEEIHIFALANVLQRPILVLCDDIHRGNCDESLGEVNLGGIYLPLLCDSVDCVKSPIVIAYDHGHFTALVSTEDGNIMGEGMIDKQSNKNAVPLLKYDDFPMQIHFLLPHEQQCSDRLLREYLNCSKVEYTQDEVTRTILVTSIHSQEPEAHLEQMFKTFFEALQEAYLQKLAERQLSISGGNMQAHPVDVSYSMKHDNKKSAPRCCSTHKQCTNTPCENYTRTNDHCHQCRKAKPSLCTSPGCAFTANPDYEGLCSVCFTRYRAILEQECTMITKPSAPPRNTCSSHKCHNEASPHFNGKCHKCYMEYIQDPNFGGITTKTSQGEQLRSATLVRNNAISAPSPALSRQNSRLYCSTEMCNNLLQNSEQVYCEVCMAHLPFDLRTNYSICDVHGCNSPAVTYHGELCEEHYKQYMEGQQGQPIQKVGIHCINSGCQFYGHPKHNYLCSQCHAKALAEYDMKIKQAQDRAQIERITQFERSDHSQCELQRKPFYYEAIGKQNRSASAPPSPNIKRLVKMVPCVTKGCPSLGTEQKQGLCDTCYDKKEMLLYQGVSMRTRHTSMP